METIFSNKQYDYDLFGEEVKEESKGILLDKFIIPPFSVFDTKQGYWQDKKREWLKLGIKSEVGRGDNYEEDKIIQQENYIKL